MRQWIFQQLDGRSLSTHDTDIVLEGARDLLRAAVPVPGLGVGGV